MKHSYQASEHIMLEKEHILLVAYISTGHLREKGTSPTASEWCAGGPPAKARDIRDTGSIPESGQFPWRLNGKESTCNAGAAGDVGLIPGLERSPRGGIGNPLQYCC